MRAQELSVRRRRPQAPVADGVDEVVDARLDLPGSSSVCRRAANCLPVRRMIL